MVEKVYSTQYLLSETRLLVHIHHVWDDLFLHSCWPILLVFGLAEWKKICFLFHFCKKQSQICTYLHKDFVPNFRHFHIHLSSPSSCCSTLYKMPFASFVQGIPSVCFRIHSESPAPTTEAFYVGPVCLVTAISCFTTQPSGMASNEFTLGTAYLCAHRPLHCHISLTSCTTPKPPPLGS